VLGKEAEKLLRRAIVAESLRPDFLALEHALKQLFALAAPLHALVDVEVKHAERTDLLDLTTLVSDEELLDSHLQEAKHLVALSSQIETIIACE